MHDSGPEQSNGDGRQQTSHHEYPAMSADVPLRKSVRLQARAAWLESRAAATESRTSAISVTYPAAARVNSAITMTASACQPTN